MRLSSLISATLSFVAFTAASTFAANPMYDSWAKHKPGTSVTLKSATEASGMKTDSEQVYTLKEVTPEKVVIELKSSMIVMGNKTDTPAVTMEIPSGGEAAPAANATVAAGGATVKTSEETVSVAGKEYKATVTETTMDANGMKSSTKTWTSNDVPNLTLKSVVKTEGAMASSTTTELSAIDLK
ncbi:MAG: hypothetical protein QM770_20650 [Tepidisphaeraceae bacterium]